MNAYFTPANISLQKGGKTSGRGGGGGPGSAQKGWLANDFTPSPPSKIVHMNCKHQKCNGGPYVRAGHGGARVLGARAWLRQWGRQRHAQKTKSIQPQLCWGAGRLHMGSNFHSQLCATPKGVIERRHGVALARDRGALNREPPAGHLFTHIPCPLLTATQPALMPIR
jgi:hypothetical protein